MSFRVIVQGEEIARMIQFHKRHLLISVILICLGTIACFLTKPPQLLALLYDQPQAQADVSLMFLLSALLLIGGLIGGAIHGGGIIELRIAEKKGKAISYGPIA